VTAGKVPKNKKTNRGKMYFLAQLLLHALAAFVSRVLFLLPVRPANRALLAWSTFHV